MTWRVARALDVLLDEINAAAPNRSRVSDGSIGDALHAARTSDHNPWVTVAGQGVVRARDFTHDPAGGLDCQRLADRLAGRLATGHHPACRSGAYVIWRGRIFSHDRRNEGWRPYTGSNPHDHHLHLSVCLAATGFDSFRAWGVMKPKRTPKPPKPKPKRKARIVLCNLHATSNPAIVVPWLIARCLTNRVDAVLLSECTHRHARVLRALPLWRLVKSPKGDEAILIRRKVASNRAVFSIPTKTWMGKHTGKAHKPRTLPMVTARGWLPLVSVHFPPGWLDGPADRQAAGDEYLAALGKVAQAAKGPLLLGGDWNALADALARWRRLRDLDSWGRGIDHVAGRGFKLAERKALGRARGMDHDAWLYEVSER